MSYNFIVYYFQCQSYHIYNTLTKKITLKKTLPKKVNNFEMLGRNYKATDEDLIKYANDLIKCNDEMNQYLRSQNINYDYLKSNIKNGVEQPVNHYKNTMSFFKCFSNKEIRERINKSEVIDKIEESYYMRCHNAGLRYDGYDSNGQLVDCYGYDKKNFYSSILSESSYSIANGKNKPKNSYFQIPTNKGYESKITEIDINNIKYGIYNVLISCDDKEINKVFCFSKDQYYTHYSLIHAYRLKEYFPTLKIELITNNKYNCYVYDEVVESNKLFSSWFKHIKKLKELYPKNIIVKILSSNLWGTLSKYKKVTYNYDTIENMKIDVGTDFNDNDYLIDEHIDDKMTLINTNDPYSYKFRLKPFVTSFGRAYMSSIIFHYGYKDVIRVCCDAAIFNKPLDIKPSSTFIIEDKHTGQFLMPFKLNNL